MPETLTDDETRRLTRLRDLVILDTEPEPVFDRIARLASEVCGVPIALLSLIDAERQWFKANVGLPGVNETPRDVAFCAHAIGGDELFEVPDATHDPRFAVNPLVTGAPDIRFYAGAPLRLPGGERVGTLCVIDRQARRLSAEQATMLRSLADIATQALLMRRELITRTLSVRSSFEQALDDSEARYRAIVEDQAELISLAWPDGTLVYVNRSYAQHFGQEAAAMRGRSLFEFVAPGDQAEVRALLARVLGQGEIGRGENRMVAADGSERWVAWTNRAQRERDGRLLLHSVGRDITERKRTERALRDSQGLLERTGRVAGVGGWQLDLVNGALTWSEQTRRIHEVADDFVPTLDSAIAFYAPEARRAIESAVQTAMKTGQAWDLELPFISARERPIWVRAQGEAEFMDGVPVRLVGAFQDITDRKQLETRLADSERFVRLVADNLPQRIAYVDRDLRYRFVNRAHAHRFGREPAQVLGRTRAELTGVAVDAAVAAHFEQVLQGQPQRFEFDEDAPDGPRHFDCQFLPDVGPDGAVRGIFTTSIDITHQAQARQDLLRQGATLRAVAEAVPGIVAVVGVDLRYRFVNSGFERWMGRPRQQVVGRPLAEVLSAEDLERSLPWVRRVLAGEAVQFERISVHRGQGRNLAMSYTPLLLESGVIDGFIGVGQDITHHRREQTRLLDLSERDPLTGLLNRAGFERRIQLDIEQGRGATLALLYVDLDHFKPVNDQHGHPVGDLLLQAFAQRLLALVRPSDVVARLGGDEFAVLLFGVREGGHAHAVADKVIAAAHAPFNIDGLDLSIGASVGAAFGADAASGWRGLVARADAQLYRAKEAGRGRQAGATDFSPM